MKPAMDRHEVNTSSLDSPSGRWLTTLGPAPEAFTTHREIITRSRSGQSGQSDKRGVCGNHPVSATGL